MISIKYRDKFGNRIFQYCLGRILAEVHNCDLQCEPLPYFINAQPITGRKIIREPTIRLRRHSIDFSSAIKTPAHYILHGWFQRYEYYKDYKSLIKTWITMPDNPDLKILNVTKDDMVVHLRLTDMTNINYSYLHIAMEKYKVPGRRFLVTDDAADPRAVEFIRRYNLIVYTKSEIDDWTFIRGFNTIILGCSTYSWWSAFLSDATTIVYPKTGYFSTTRTNLFVDDEPRYKLLNF